MSRTDTLYRFGVSLLNSRWLPYLILVAMLGILIYSLSRYRPNGDELAQNLFLQPSTPPTVMETRTEPLHGARKPAPGTGSAHSLIGKGTGSSVQPQSASEEDEQLKARVTDGVRTFFRHAYDMKAEDVSVDVTIRQGEE